MKLQNEDETAEEIVHATHGRRNVGQIKDMMNTAKPIVDRDPELINIARNTTAKIMTHTRCHS